MMLKHNQIAIFSQPRTGTKLLAKILKNFGYHYYGEWYANLSTVIQDDVSIRRETYLEKPLSASQSHYVNSIEYIKRYQQLLNIKKKFPRSVITIWPQAMFEFPFIVNQFIDYHWICIKRNPWDQLLSFYISSINKNFDGLHQSVSTLFKEITFRKLYWDYHTTATIQQWLIDNQVATMIDFDELVTGSSKVFGIPYDVATKDEHEQLESLVENLDQVKNWYASLELARLNN